MVPKPADACKGAKSRFCVGWVSRPKADQKLILAKIAIFAPSSTPLAGVGQTAPPPSSRIEVAKDYLSNFSFRLGLQVGYLSEAKVRFSGFKVYACKKILQILDTPKLS